MNQKINNLIIVVVFLISNFFLTSCDTKTLTPTKKPTQVKVESPITPTPTQKSDDIIALGYYTGSPKSYNSFVEFSSFLDIVSVDVYGLHLDGTVVGTDDYDIATQSHSDDIEFYACISNWNSDPAVDNFDPDLAFAAMITYKAEVIEQLVTLAGSEGYSGINIDFENIAYSADLANSRIAFNGFIHELSVRLHENNKKLIISVAAKESDDPNNDWSYPYDLAALGKDADYLQLMTYDQHGAWGGPGPVSGVDWLEEVVIYSSSVVDPSKLLIGLPAYGYDWDLSLPGAEEGTYATTSFSWVDIPALLDRPGAESFWDEATQSPSVKYVENGHDHVAWFENTESIQTKVNLITRYNLAGLSVWALGMEDLSFWQAASTENK